MVRRGGSPFALYRVPFFLGSVLMLVCMGATTLGEPWGVQGLRDLMSRSAQRALAEGTQPGRFTEWVSGVVFYAEEGEGNRLEKVFFTDRRDLIGPLQCLPGQVESLRERIRREILFELKDGNIWIQDRLSGSQRMLRFGETVYRLDVGNLVGNKARTHSSCSGQDTGAIESGH